MCVPALVIQMGAMYLYGPLLDVFPRHFFDGDLSGFLKLLGKTIGGIVLVGIACSIVLELVGSWALQLLFGSSIEPYVYLLQPIILSTILTAFLWFFGDLLITLRNFKANFIGNIVALVSVLAVTFPFVNLWDMNGVSFAGAVACLAGVLTLLGFLIATVRRGPARAHGGNGERTDG